MTNLILMTATPACLPWLPLSPSDWGHTHIYTRQTNRFDDCCCGGAGPAGPAVKPAGPAEKTTKIIKTLKPETLNPPPQVLDLLAPQLSPEEQVRAPCGCRV